MTEDYRRLYFITLFALVFYVVGAGFIQSFVNYPTWHLVGADEFKTFHNGMSPLIIRFMVLPWLAEILLTILLLRLRPRVVPGWAVGLALALNAVSVVSTALIQIPNQQPRSKLRGMKVIVFGEHSQQAAGNVPARE